MNSTLMAVAALVLAGCSTDDKRGAGAGERAAKVLERL
jgi:outer membrane biogenesis lipoprotein LolB